MREIKFRAWDKKFKLLLKNVQNDQEILDRIHDCHMINTWMTFEDFVEDDGFRFVIEQYTGAKDKNDKEIYEGDIVRAIGRSLSFVVIFEAGKFILKNDCEKLPVSTILNIQVVGNIHENADLLKGDEK